MKGRLDLVAAAFALTALSYGLARFAYGLLLPDIRADLSLGAAGAGWIGGGAFAAYCVGIVAAIVGGPRVGERALAVTAGLMATGCLALVAVATSAWSLGLAIALGGLSTGLTSPPLATAVDRRIDEPSRPAANGAINAGTAAGIILSGVAVVAFAGGWRALYGGFAAIGVVVSVWLWFAIPAGRRAWPSAGRPAPRLRRPGLGALCAGALLMGAASTAVWTFGANLMREALGLDDGSIALGWIVLGAAGLAGIGTGVLGRRLGIGAVHRGAVFAMALALLGVAAAHLAPLASLAAMGLFGLAYIVSSGAFLLWGIALFPDRPDVGLGLPFLLIAVGQTVGAPVFGALWEAVGSVAALLAMSGVMASAACWTARAAAGQAAPRRARSA